MLLQKFLSRKKLSRKYRSIFGLKNQSCDRRLLVTCPYDTGFCASAPVVVCADATGAETGAPDEHCAPGMRANAVSILSANFCACAPVVVCATATTDLHLAWNTFPHSQSFLASHLSKRVDRLNKQLVP